MDNSLMWVDQKILDIASNFAIEGSLDCAFARIGPSDE